MSKDMKIRRPSPVARLMGLDVLPSSPVGPQRQKEMETCFKKMPSTGFQEKYAKSENFSFRTRTNEHQVFKDVFEVVEMPKVKKHKSQPTLKDISRLRQSEIDMTFLQQKFSNSKQLSTDKALSKEFHYTSGVLDCNDDLFYKFLKEPNSLFKKHLQDLNTAPCSPDASCITVLKSRKGTEYESSDLCCKSERNLKRCVHIQRGDISSSSKPSAGLPRLSCQPPEEQISHPCNQKSLYAEKIEADLQPTRIVLLKPSLEKAQNAASDVWPTSFPENFQFCASRHGEIQLSKKLDFYKGGRDQQKFSDRVKVAGHATSGSREIAREVTKQMRKNGSGGNEKVAGLKFRGHVRDESVHVMSGRANQDSDPTKKKNQDSEAFRWISNHSSECDSFSPSSPCISESSLIREARKRLLERWESAHKVQEVGHGGRGPSTLGEMLALPDREISRTLGIRRVSNKMIRDEALARKGCSSGISGNNVCKDGCYINLPRSESLPASCLVYERVNHKGSNQVGGRSNSSVLKDIAKKIPNGSLDGNLNQQRNSLLGNFSSCGKKDPFCSDGEGNNLSNQCVHMNFEELRKRIHVRCLSKEECMIPELSDCSVADKGHLADNFSAHLCHDAKYSNDKRVQQPTPSELLSDIGKLSCNNQNEIVVKETRTKHPRVDSSQSHSYRLEASSPVRLQETDQPSPVSVLEPMSEEEKSSSGGFEKINANLQELEMQLRLLKFESSDTHADDLEFLFSSEEDNGEECNSIMQLGEMLEAFKGDEDRDFSYLVDLLIDSGVLGADKDGLLNACHSTQYPVDPSVFDKLEKKYSVLVSWSRSERKLLFDLINSILADFMNPFMDLTQRMKSRRCLQSWAREGLMEELWQMVVKRRKDDSCSQERLLESRWLDLGVDVDVVGRDVVRMLNEELIQELVVELVSV